MEDLNVSFFPRKLDHFKPFFHLKWKNAQVIVDYRMIKRTNLVACVKIDGFFPPEKQKQNKSAALSSLIEETFHSITWIIKHCGTISSSRSSGCMALFVISSSSYWPFIWCVFALCIDAQYKSLCQRVCNYFNFGTKTTTSEKKSPCTERETTARAYNQRDEE